MDANPGDDQQGARRGDGLSDDGMWGRSARDLLHDISRRVEAARDQRVADGPAWRLRVPRSSERAPTRDAEFAELARELHQLLRETDGQLDRLGHDARVGLTVIKGRAQLLRRQVLATGAPDLQLIRSMDEIERAVARLHRLLNDQLAPATARSPSETGDGRADEP